jgi:hypothetical protein
MQFFKMAQTFFFHSLAGWMLASTWFIGCLSTRRGCYLRAHIALFVSVYSALPHFLFLSKCSRGPVTELYFVFCSTKSEYIRDIIICLQLLLPSWDCSICDGSVFYYIFYSIICYLRVRPSGWHIKYLWAG